MPSIGDIDVPESLWSRLVQDSTLEFASLILSEAQQHSDENNLEVDLTQERKELEPYESTNEEITHLENCVVALIRIQSGNFAVSDDEVKQSKAYLDIWEAASEVAEQINFDLLPPNGHLASIAKTHIEPSSKISF